MHMHIHLHNIHIYIYIYMYIYIYIDIDTCIYIYIYAHIHIHTHIHIYTWRLWESRSLASRASGKTMSRRFGLGGSNRPSSGDAELPGAAYVVPFWP